MKSIVLMTVACYSLICMSCSRGGQIIEYGKDACAHCKMTIIDDRYAAELITEKGRVYKFDDVQCMKQFRESNEVAGIVTLFVEDYLRRAEHPVDATKAVYLQHEMFRSPMKGNYAAFANATDAQQLMDSLKLPLLHWENLR